MKLQVIPQPKVQYNQQIENNHHCLAAFELLVIFLELIKNQTAKWVLL